MDAVTRTADERSRDEDASVHEENEKKDLGVVDDEEVTDTPGESSSDFNIRYVSTNKEASSMMKEVTEEKQEERGNGGEVTRSEDVDVLQIRAMYAKVRESLRREEKENEASDNHSLNNLRLEIGSLLCEEQHDCDRVSRIVDLFESSRSLLETLLPGEKKTSPFDKLRQISTTMEKSEDGEKRLSRFLEEWPLPKDRRKLLKMMKSHESTLLLSGNTFEHGMPFDVFDDDDDENGQVAATAIPRSGSQHRKDITEVLRCGSDVDKQSIRWIAHCNPELAKTLVSDVAHPMSDSFWDDVRRSSKEFVATLKQDRSRSRQLFEDILAERNYVEGRNHESTQTLSELLSSTGTEAVTNIPVQSTPSPRAREEHNGPKPE